MKIRRFFILSFFKYSYLVIFSFIFSFHNEVKGQKELLNTIAVDIGNDFIKVI